MREEQILKSALREIPTPEIKKCFFHGTTAQQHNSTTAQQHNSTTAQQPPVGQGLLIIMASRSHSDTPYSVGLLWTSDQPDAQTSTCITHNTHNRQTDRQTCESASVSHLYVHCPSCSVPLQSHFRQIFYISVNNQGADKSLAQPTSRYILFDASLDIYINTTNIPPIMIINRIHEIKIFCRCSLFPSWSAKDLSAPLYNVSVSHLPLLCTGNSRHLESHFMQNQLQLLIFSAPAKIK